MLHFKYLAKSMTRVEKVSCPTVSAILTSIKKETQKRKKIINFCPMHSCISPIYFAVTKFGEDFLQP